jgi:flagellar protein FliJ
MADPHKLARIHRVRTLQLGLARADELAAGQKAAGEAELSRRIADLAAAVAPVPGGGFAALHAAAHYRDRLHQSAAAAAHRVAAAQAAHARAAEATRAAHRDQGAVEKLLARAAADERRREARALEDAAGRSCTLPARSLLSQAA